MFDKVLRKSQIAQESLFFIMLFYIFIMLFYILIMLFYIFIMLFYIFIIYAQMLSAKNPLF